MKDVQKAICISLVLAISCNAALAVDHLVLGVSEFLDLPDKLLSFEDFSKLKEEPGYIDSDECEHVEQTKCWLKAERSAAKQFAARMKGLPEKAILDNVGGPYVCLTKLNYWNQSHDKVADWIYFFGFEGIPVRLRISNGQCTDSFLINSEELSSYSKFMASCFKDLDGMSEDQVIDRLGNPAEIEFELPFKKNFKYRVERNGGGGITFEFGKCILSGFYHRSGWLHREEAIQKSKGKGKQP